MNENSLNKMEGERVCQLGAFLKLVIDSIVLTIEQYSRNIRNVCCTKGIQLQSFSLFMHLNLKFLEKPTIF